MVNIGSIYRKYLLLYFELMTLILSFFRRLAVSFASDLEEGFIQRGKSFTFIVM